MSKINQNKQNPNKTGKKNLISTSTNTENKVPENEQGASSDVRTPYHWPWLLENLSIFLLENAASGQLSQQAEREGRRY